MKGTIINIYFTAQNFTTRNFTLLRKFLQLEKYFFYKNWIHLKSFKHSKIYNRFYTYLCDRVSINYKTIFTWLHIYLIEDWIEIACDKYFLCSKNVLS